MRPILACITCIVLTVALTAQDAEPQFEVASLKPSIADTGSFVFPAKPGPGDVRLPRVPLRVLILRGYPLPPPFEVANLPKWAENDLYDFAAKKDPGATADQQQAMFRAFLAERLKLDAHYETKDQQGYNLVFARADRRPGPGLQPTSLDCTQPAPRPSPGVDGVKFASSTCGFSMTDLDGTLRSAGLTMEVFARRLSATVGKPIMDKTGLSGSYAISVRFEQRPLNIGVAPSPDDPPSVFTALPEQLGLKLEPATTAGQILVIDHIERPSEN